MPSLGRSLSSVVVSALATHAKGLGSNLGTGVDFSLCESCLVILVSDPRHYKRSGANLMCVIRNVVDKHVIEKFKRYLKFHIMIIHTSNYLFTKFSYFKGQYHALFYCWGKKKIKIPKVITEREKKRNH